MKKILAIGFLLGGIATLQAEIKLPAVVGDHMVLQQNTDARLWGWASPKSSVTIQPSWSETPYTVKADDKGRWAVAVATGPASMEAKSITITEKGSKSSDQRVVNDILFGEVWLASGQSNMQMPLKGFPGCPVKNGLTDAINAYRDTPGVRMMNVQLDQKSEEQEDCVGAWQLPTFPNTMDWSATAYYFAANLSQSLQIPVGIVNAAYGGAKVESWCSKDLLKQYPDVDLNIDHIWALEPQYHRPLLMYNAMFCPIKNYTYKGIIWYQGCSNVGTGPESTEYAQRLANMVKLWRDQIGLGDIPFHFVEIAPYAYDGTQGNQSAYLREQQYKAEKLIPNSYIVSTNNLVEPFEPYNIHPRQKRKVGERLCWVALNRIYGMNEVCCTGPRYKDMEVRGDTCLVSFTDLQMGICRNYDIQGFEVAGEDKVFYPSEETSLRWQTNQVLVRSNKVPKPVAVRYCFRDFQIGTLYGGNELPAFPFRTDNW